MTILFLLFSLCSFAREETPKADELLKTSDRARGAAYDLAGISWIAEIHSVENGDATDATYSIKAKNTNTVAEAIAPARQKGEIVLFNDRTLWFYKPGLKKPVSISPRQKLMGQAANGDIASTQYARDYEAVALNADKVDGQEAWKLTLKAKAKNVTYDKINYWIAKKTQTAVKAQFLTLAGEVFKSATFHYGNEINVHGKAYPFVDEMKIIDTANPENSTTLHYRNPKEQAHPTGIFNVNNLMK